MESSGEFERELVAIEHFATQLRAVLARVNEAFGPILMMTPPPPPPPIYNTTEFKKRENFNGWSIKGPTKSETDAAGIKVIVSQGGTAPPTLTVTHPPPPGAANQAHTLKNGDRVTVYPNGDILIEQQ